MTLFLTACNSQPNSQPKEQAPLPAHDASPVAHNAPVYLDTLGTLHASYAVDIRPQVEGTLSEILVHEGQWVKEGDPLFKIDPILFQILYKETEAQHGIDKADLEAAQKKLARFLSLAEKDLVAQTEWDELNARAAKAEAALLFGQARLEAARLNLSNCTLKAPFSGRIGKIDANPGQLVDKLSRLTSIASLDPLRLDFTVKETDFPHLHLNEIELLPLDLALASIPAQITFIDHQIDPQTGLLLIHANVPNEKHELLPGQSVRIHIPIPTTDKAFLIPQNGGR